MKKLQWLRTPMVTLDVRFKCECCGAEVFHRIRVGPHFFLSADQLPEGWVVRTGEYFIRSYCPLHAMDAK
mgnify:CR=1 FL=1